MNQNFTDGDTEFEFAESCIEKAKNVKFRAELLTYSKSFFDSLDLLFNTKVGGDYWIRAKRLGYLLWRIKDRYKDETMDLKWASQKSANLLINIYFHWELIRKFSKFQYYPMSLERKLTI